MTILTLSRRQALRSVIAGAGVTALAACSVTSSGGTTAATLDVAKVEAYADAILNFGSEILATPTVTALLGASNVATATALVAQIKTGLASFIEAAGTATTVSLDDTSIATIAQSLLADFQSLLSLVQTVVSLIPAGTIATTISTAVTAATTISALMQAMLTVVATKAPRAMAAITPMPEAQALARLGIQ